MPLTVGELRKALADAPDDANLMLIHDGKLLHAGGVAVASNGALAIIRSHGEPRQSKHFSVLEDGLLGGLSAMGMSDDALAELLERPVDSVRKRKKKLGLK